MTDTAARAVEDQAAAAYEDAVAKLNRKKESSRQAFAEARDALVDARQARRLSEGRIAPSIGGDATKEA